MDETIKSLTPSAARLLLAFLTSSKDEEHDNIIVRSGIHTLATYDRAEQELIEAGYVRIVEGSLFINLHKFQGKS